jgi:23S rRNA pseudouridine2605 synthase
MRLAKYVASSGVASRRASEEIVRAGRVTVNGDMVNDPAHEVRGSDQVAVDGTAIELPAGRIVYAVNKPAGVVSTARDPQGRPTVVSLVDSPRRLYPVGRLDADSTGLILLTDDGDLAHRLTHPSFEVEKVYRVRVANPPVRRAAVGALREGVELQDGRTAPAKVRMVAPDTLEITIHEGRKRQVKRMCEAVGHPVIALTRVRFGPLELGRLGPGSARRLRADEVSTLTSAGLPASPGAASSYTGRGRPASP